MSETQKRYYWKGKLVTKKVYLQRSKQKELGKNLRNIYGSKTNTHNLKEVTKVNGYRIVHLETLGKTLVCKKCKAILSLQDIVDEQRHGLASNLFVKCRACNVISCVATDKRHKTENQKNKSHHDSNTNIVIDTLNVGQGNTHVNEILSDLNIPELSWNVFKTAKKSELTIQKADEREQLL